MVHSIREQRPEMPKGRCAKFKVYLEGKDYFLEHSDDFKVVQEPLTPFFIEKCYSEIFDPATKKLIGIQKHTFKRVFCTGVELELALLPTWWDKRDEMVC
jgi:hypothetical protein